MIFTLTSVIVLSIYRAGVFTANPADAIVPGFAKLAQRADWMKPAKSKKQQHQELLAQIRDFQAHGGTVKEVPPGHSGRDDGNRPLPHVFDKKSEPQTRTSVSEVIAAIEQRRRPRPPLKDNRHKKLSRPRKKIIYDEFGEPLRWEWEQ